MESKFTINQDSATTLLEKYSVIETADIEQACESISNAYIDHQVWVTDRCQDRRYIFRHACLGEIGLSLFETKGTIHSYVPNFEDFYTFNVGLSGTTSFTVGNITNTVIKNSVIALSPNSPIKIIANSSSQLVLKLDKRDIDYLAPRIFGEDLNCNIKFDPRIDPLPAQTIVELVKFLAMDGQNEFSMMRTSNTLNHLKEGFIIWALQNLDHNYRVRMNKVVPETDSTHLKKAVEYIYENASEEITIAKLAGISGCSIRSLHRSFRTHYACTPMQLLRHVRLDKARRDLLSSSSNESVTAIALNWGFLHFGRFSKYYAEQFGELPSETKRKQRA